MARANSWNDLETKNNDWFDLAFSLFLWGPWRFGDANLMIATLRYQIWSILVEQLFRHRVSRFRDSARLLGESRWPKKHEQVAQSGPLARKSRYSRKMIGWWSPETNLILFDFTTGNSSLEPWPLPEGLLSQIHMDSSSRFSAGIEPGICGLLFSS